MENIKILISSGGTTEYIDDVRVLTNVSSGALGAMIADEYIKSNSFDQNIEIHYICTKNTIKPKNTINALNTHFCYHIIKDVRDLVSITAELVPKMDIVIHAMAVSDFGFTPCKTKLKSNSPEDFINSMRERITVNPKVLSYFRKWNPDCILVSFKFEVGQTPEKLNEIAYKSLMNNKCDLVVANDKAEMQNENAHIGYIQDKWSNIIKCNSKKEIVSSLLSEIKNIYLTNLLNKLTNVSIITLEIIYNNSQTHIIGYKRINPSTITFNDEDNKWHIHDRYPP
jgi:phosphopantothenate-cysteine ligase